MNKLIHILLLVVVVFAGVDAVAGTQGRSRTVVSGDNPLWGNDVIVSSSEPTGRASAAARSNGMVYAAVPDTGGGSGYVVKMYRSTDFGDSWSPVGTGPSSSAAFAKVKVVRTGADSIYALAQSGTSLYSWNVETPAPTVIAADAARDFDVVASGSTNDLFLFVDVATTNQIRRFGSTNGGATWDANTALVTSAGAHPRVYMSTGDTLVLNYYGPVQADTATSVIRAARYRRTNPGTLASINFVDVMTETVRKDQFASVIHAGRIWFFFTSGDSGGRDIRCRVSLDNGVSYGSPINVAGNPMLDEYWFDARNWSGGCDLAFVADTSGGASRMSHQYSDVSDPSSFSPPEPFSEHPPVYSALGYIPTVVEFYDSGDDLGAIWVGLNGSPGLYWDRFNALPVGVEEQPLTVPASFALSQNYPNPFNPSTTIRYEIASQEFVALKVFDVLGREVTTLVNEVQEPGTYGVTWNAAGIASGVYYYRLIAGGFTETKRLVLLR